MLATLTTTLAHAGHDHTFTPGGQWHHYLWLAVGVVVVAAIARAVLRQTKK